MAAPFILLIDRPRMIEGTDAWEVEAAIGYGGGTAPYQFALDDGPPQERPYFMIRWQACQPLTLTVHVRSGDGSGVHRSVTHPGWCPE